MTLHNETCMSGNSFQVTRSDAIFTWWRTSTWKSSLPDFVSLWIIPNYHHCLEWNLPFENYYHETHTFENLYSCGLSLYLPWKLLNFPVSTCDKFEPWDKKNRLVWLLILLTKRKHLWISINFFLPSISFSFLFAVWNSTSFTMSSCDIGVCKTLHCDVFFLFNMASASWIVQIVQRFTYLHREIFAVLIYVRNDCRSWGTISTSVMKENVIQMNDGE